MVVKHNIAMSGLSNAESNVGNMCKELFRLIPVYGLFSSSLLYGGRRERLHARPGRIHWRGPAGDLQPMYCRVLRPCSS